MLSCSTNFRDMVRRIDHINIVVTDLRAAVSFFLLLGFKEGLSSRLSGEQLSLVTGLYDIDAEFITLLAPGESDQAAGAKIELIQYFSPPGSKEPGIERANQVGIRHIAFAVDDIDTLVTSLKSNGVQFQSKVQTWPKTGKRLVYFYGPDNILLEFCQYPEDK